MVPYFINSRDGSGICSCAIDDCARRETTALIGPVFEQCCWVAIRGIFAV